MKKTHILMVIAILLLDQVTKYMVNAAMDIGQRVSVISGFFHISNVHNTGAAWSILEGNMIFFYVISVLFLIGMVYFYRHSDEADTLTKYGIVLMVAGTLGNLVDRLRFQYVRDFFDFNIFGYNFPVFNVADMSLCIGVGLVVVSLILESYRGVEHA